MSNKYKELTGNTLIFAIGSLGSKLVTFFLVPLYTNVLSRDEYGTVDLVQTLANLLVPIFSLMIQDAVLRFCINKESDKRVVIKNALYVTIVGGGLGLLCVPIMSLYAPIKDWVLYLYIIMLTNMIVNVMYAYVKSKDMNRLYSLCGILSTLVMCVLNIIFLLVYDWGMKGYLLGIIGSQVFSIVFLCLFGKIFNDLMGSRGNFFVLKDMLHYSIPLIINNLSWWIINSSDRIMIEYYSSASEVGLFAAASKIPALISVINSVFLQAWTLSSIREYEDDKDLSFFSTIFSLYSVVMFFACSSIIFILKDFMKIYVEAEYVQAWNLVPLLLFGSIYYGFSLFFGTIYSAAKQNKNITVSTVVAAIINITANIILFPKIGVITACVSTAISYGFVGIYRMIDSRRFLRFKIDVTRLVLNSIVLLVQVILVTLDCYRYRVSIGALFFLALINWNIIKEIPKVLGGIMVRRK